MTSPNTKGHMVCDGTCIRSQIHRDRKRKGTDRAGELALKGHGTSVWEDEKLLEVNSGEWLNLNVLNATNLYT